MWEEGSPERKKIVISIVWLFEIALFAQYGTRVKPEGGSSSPPEIAGFGAFSRGHIAIQYSSRDSFRSTMNTCL